MEVCRSLLWSVQRVVLGILIGVGPTAAPGSLEVKMDEEHIARSSGFSTPRY
jgi:hypothetical protein